jgi:hypothetical protein
MIEMYQDIGRKGKEWAKAKWYCLISNKPLLMDHQRALQAFYEVFKDENAADQIEWNLYGHAI